MSNRTLAIIGFAIFMIALIFELEQIHDELRGQTFFSQHRSETVSTPGGDRTTSALLLMIANQQALANSLEVEIASKVHPELADELEYHQFVTDVMTVTATGGVVTFAPLATRYKDKLDKLSSRFKQDHPEIAIPK
jgi:hypothetical protein